MTNLPESEHPAPVPEAGSPPPLPRQRRLHVAAARHKKARQASVWVLVIAILQVLFGIFFGFRNSKESDDALRELVDFSAEEVLTSEDQEHTVAQWRAMIEQERVQVFAIPIGLGVVFFAIYLWARSSPVPALGTALALFVMVHAVDALVDPTNLLRGIILKVLFIAALIKGLESALEQRAEEQRAADAGAEDPLPSA